MVDIRRHPQTRLASIYARQNVPQVRAEMMTSALRDMPDDDFGFSAVARIPLMAMRGRALGEAAQFEEERTQQATEAIRDLEDREWAGKMLDYVGELARTDPVYANNVLQTEGLRNPYLYPFTKYNIVGKAQGDWQMLENRDTGEVSWFNKGALPEIERLQAAGDTEGARRLTEQSTAIIRAGTKPEVEVDTGQQHKNALINHYVSNRLTAMNRPDLLGQPMEVVLPHLPPDVQENIRIMQTYPASPDGLRAIRDIVFPPQPEPTFEERERYKHQLDLERIYTQDRLRRAGERAERKTVAQINAEVLGKYLAGETLTPNEERVVNDMLKDPDYDRAIRIVTADPRSLAYTHTQFYAEVEKVVEQMRRQRNRTANRPAAPPPASDTPLLDTLLGAGAGRATPQQPQPRLFQPTQPPAPQPTPQPQAQPFTREQIMADLIKRARAGDAEAQRVLTQRGVRW